jgi:mono/diheme cytochrome c family protein
MSHRRTATQIVAAGIALAGCNPFAIPEVDLYAEPQHPELLAHLEEQTQIVDQYGVIDESAGVYRVPVDKAIARVAADPNLLEPLVELKSDLSEMTVVQQGEYHFVNTYACGACHSLQGERKVGPHLNNRWGGEAPIEGGEVLAFNDAYFKESVYYSQAKIARGYPAAMPVFAGQMEDEHFEAIKAYLLTFQ